MRLPIVVGVSPTLKIRGIIASENIKKGRVIERCPVILMPKKEEKLIEQTIVSNYYFDWSNTYNALVLGYGSLYNHSYTPNAQYVFNYKKKLMVYRAIKSIPKGEEITINYNYYPRSKAKIEEKYMVPDKKYNVIAK
jgi:uncharacterized protein